MRIRDMDWEDLKQMLRVIGPEIGRLAQRGDGFARRVYDRYLAAANHPNDLKMNRELRAAFEDYLSRDLRIAERIDLGVKYGHLLNESPDRVSVFMPGKKN